jgi:hypothetical protein
MHTKISGGSTRNSSPSTPLGIGAHLDRVMDYVMVDGVPEREHLVGGSYCGEYKRDLNILWLAMRTRMLVHSCPQ